MNTATIEKVKLNVTLRKFDAFVLGVVAPGVRKNGFAYATVYRMN